MFTTETVLVQVSKGIICVFKILYDDGEVKINVYKPVQFYEFSALSAPHTSGVSWVGHAACMVEKRNLHFCKLKPFYKRVLISP